MSVYVHIPFCERKCKYCAFNSFCGSNEDKENYIDLLTQEIARRKVDAVVKTLYIGGGTPSVLSEQQIERVFSALKANPEFSKDAEVTIEANPNSISQPLLEKWRQLGVNRLSVGVQSLNDASLEKIGRLHSKQQVLEKIALASRFFDNISCDLIVGLENENGQQLCQHAQALLQLGIKHVSCYLLEIPQGTEIEKMVKSKEYFPLDDGQVIDAFNELAGFLEERGFVRYEISNFGLPGFESKHNLNYWARGEYLGFGLSAHSFIDGKRIENAQTISDYARGICKVENLSSVEEDEEKIMLGLRCDLGVDLSTLSNKKVCENPYFKEYIKKGILCQRGDVVRMNKKFWHVSNTIISNLL